MKKHETGLVDRYLLAVKMWLPARQREDIAAELGDDIRSEIEEMEGGLGRKLNDDELAAVLRRRGRPIVAAARFRPQRSLIGPTFFPIYMLALRAAAIPFGVLWVVRWVFGFITSGAIRTESPATWAIQAASAFWASAFFVFGTVTLVFAALEAIQRRTRFLESWNPRRLAPVRDVRRVARSSAFTDLAVQVAFTLWWVRPGAFFSLESGGMRWSAGATWDHLHGTFFVPVLLLSFLMGAVALARLLHPQETTTRGWVSAGTHWAAAVIAAFVLAGNWSSFSTEWNWLRHVARAAHQTPVSAAGGAAFATAVTDVLVYLTVASVCVGASIAFGVEVLRILRSRRGRGEGLRPAPLTTEVLCP